MIKRVSRRWFMSLFFSAASIAYIAWVKRGTAQGFVTFPKSKLTIVTAKGSHKFDIELAVSKAQQSQGLMYRPNMAADAGMLFDYKRPQKITMWMKNTRIPLDMLFIGTDGRIVNIVERTIPHSVSTVSSKGKVQAVLEVNSGTASRLGIKPGDRVSHSIFKQLK